MNNLSDDDLDKLDALLRNAVDSIERDRIIEKINTDEDWKIAYLQLLAVREVGRRQFHTDQKARFKSMGSVSGGRVIRPLWLAVAAIGALLVTALLWLLPDAAPGSQLLAEYRKFPNVVLPIEKSGDPGSPREKAYQAYELSAYQQAIVRFNTLSQLNTDDSLYLALSFFELDQIESARPLFQALQYSTSSDRASQVSEWYLMWLDILSGDIKSAERKLTRIAVTDGHRYQKEASRLLNKM